MLGTSLGTFDPVNFDDRDPATFPPSPPGGFQAGQFFVLTGPTTVNGVTAAAGDRLYVTAGVGRKVGDLTFADNVFGGEVWSDFYVAWVPNNTTAPPWQNLAPPYAGCPFFPLKDTGLLESDPQWRIIVEAYYTDVTNARLFGTGTFGSDVFGDDPTNVPVRWVDITEPSFAITIAVGDPEGGPIQPSTQMTWEVYDPEEDYFAWQTPANLYSPQVHTPIRVSLQDPNFQVYPLAVGRIERIEDEHDIPPRTVTVEAFGLMTDLVQSVGGLGRPEEPAIDRIERLLVVADWQWGTLTSPSFNVPLIARQVDAPELRAEAQLAALSTRWTLDCDRFGQIRAREWPLDPDGQVIHVADCPEDVATGHQALVTESMLLVADTTAALNHAVIENDDDPPKVGESTDITSVGRYGVRDTAYGFPLTGLSTRDQVRLDAFATRFTDRLGRIVNRVDGVVGNIAHDRDWLQIIAEIDTGRPVTAHRVGIPGRDVEIEAVTVGYEIRLAPGQASIDIHTQSITPTV